MLSHTRLTRAAVVLLLLLLSTGAVWGQVSSAPQGDDPPEVPSTFKPPEDIAAKMLEEIEDARWKLTPGFDIDTGVGLSATSRIARAFDIGGDLSSLCTFVVFDGKGEWSSAADSKNHAEIALSPTVAYCPVKKDPLRIPFVIGFTPDFRSKWGTFEEGTGDQKKTFNGNQSVLGAGVTFLFPSTPDFLKGFELTASYYTVVDSEGDLPVPKELDVDHVQVRLKSRIEPFKSASAQLLKETAFVLDGRASRAVGSSASKDFDYYTNLALEVGKGKTAGTIRWEKGKEVGFNYDKKIVVGIIFRLLELE